MSDRRFEIPGAPEAELDRSPAARRVGTLAAASGLRLAHWEHRVQLEQPEGWQPVNRPDLGQPSTWVDGVLPETKFRTFRLDRRIGSFNPSHRAKWTAHELLHGLVGFGWRPDGTALFHATAARLSEVLPVALWYFFDEAGLARCDRHTGQGPLFGTFCPACERAAQQGPAAGTDPELVEQGRAFVQRELDACDKSARTGRVWPNRWATIDLSSDGLAYAASHMAALCRTRSFARWVAGVLHARTRPPRHPRPACAGASRKCWTTCAADRLRLRWPGLRSCGWLRISATA